MSSPSNPATTQGNTFWKIQTSQGGGKCLTATGAGTSWNDITQNYLAFSADCSSEASVWRFDPYTNPPWGMQGGGALYNPAASCYMGWADYNPSKGTDNRLGCWNTPTPPLLPNTDMAIPQYIVWTMSTQANGGNGNAIGSSGYKVSAPPSFNNYAMADYYGRGERASLVNPAIVANDASIASLSIESVPAPGPANLSGLSQWWWVVLVLFAFIVFLIVMTFWHRKEDPHTLSPQGAEQVELASLLGQGGGGV